VNFGSRGVTAGHYFRDELYAHRTWKKCLHTNHTWEKNLAAMLAGQSELGAAASRKAVWWDLRLASLLTHLFVFLYVQLRFVSGGKR